MALPAGKLTKRLTIQQATETRDGFGDPVPTWSTYATRWAAIEYTGSGESLEAGSRRTELRAVIRMRYDTTTAAITAKMRGLLGSVVFDFMPPENVNQRNEEIRIEAVVRG